MPQAQAHRSGLRRDTLEVKGDLFLENQFFGPMPDTVLTFQPQTSIDTLGAVQYIDMFGVGTAIRQRDSCVRRSRRSEKA
eukprot:3458731-Pyramimonas_sp.AAC.1